ncbi:MAG: dUTP diphosphatase [Oscillospiraceae bacterium]|nr:dUTP diphosphatase [Oscillospiraceae bacterium]
MAFEIKVKKIRENAVVPKIATSGSAAADLYACIDEPVLVPARGNAAIPVGIAIAVPEGYGAFIFARSGLGIKHGIAPRNCVGVIDSDYRGEICVGLMNNSEEDYTVQPGDRIAQMAIMPVMPAEYVLCDELSETDRGTGGFGSTGK